VQRFHAQAAAAAGADMGTVNLSLSELVTGGPGLDAIHEAHHHGHHHQMPGADLQPDEETAEDEVHVLSFATDVTDCSRPSPLLLRCVAASIPSLLAADGTMSAQLSRLHALSQSLAPLVTHDQQLARHRMRAHYHPTALQKPNRSFANRRIHQASMQVMAAGTSEGGASCGRMAS